MMRNKVRIVFVIGTLALASFGCSLSSLLGGPLLQDDFSSGSGWGISTDSESSVEYSNGGLQMQIFTQNYFVWSTPNEEVYENVHIEVTVLNNNTPATTAFGILCNQQVVEDSFYYFAVTPAGEYAIAKAALALDDVFLTNDDKWGDSDLVAENAASYRLGADCGKGTLTFYVDGQQIATVSDATYTSGSVGLLTWSGEQESSANVTFDDFVVTKLE